MFNKLQLESLLIQLCCLPSLRLCRNYFKLFLLFGKFIAHSNEISYKGLALLAQLAVKSSYSFFLHSFTKHFKCALYNTAAARIVYHMELC